MSSNDVIKSVAKQLKYYFEVKRLEDGFDLSETHQPQLDHSPVKVRPTRRSVVLKDKPLKHHFICPEVRVQLTQLNGKNARQPLKSKKELQVKKLLENYMRHYCFQSHVPNCYCYHKSKGCPHGLKFSAGLTRRKKQRNIIGGWPILRAVPDQHISKGEANRLVNSATKILAATTNFGLYPGAVDYALVKYEPNLYTKSQPKKQLSALYSPAQSPRRRNASNQRVEDYSESSHNSLSSGSRPQSPTPSQSTSRSSASDASSHSSNSSKSSRSSRSTASSLTPTSARFKSQAFITLPETHLLEEVGVVQSTQTNGAFDAQQNVEKKEEEVCHGPLCVYEVYVGTGNRLGASTKAPIKMIMFGEKGRTKEFVLNDSKRHKITFQKGKEDMFILSAPHIGQITKIQIGHDRPELNYAWYLERVTVYDMHAKRIFQFPCERWLSGQDGDKKTYRILEVDNERDFIEALDVSMSKSPRTPKNKDSSDSDSSDLLVNGRSRKKLNKTGAAVNSKQTGSEYTFGRKSPYDEMHLPKAKEIKTAQSQEIKSQYVYGDHVEKSKSGPVIRLHSAHDNKQVDEIYIEAQDKSSESETIKVKGNRKHNVSQRDNMDGHSVSEEDKRHQLERERAMERNILQGKGIHDAVRAGDLDRVKDLINNFNEMKDFKDVNGWTPIHLAAARGNIDILRWLVTSDADLNAVTPKGYNAMHIAAMYGHVNSMMVLQAMGCSITSLTVEKQSALHLAAKNGHLECIKWLVANRASITQEGNTGKTAGQLAEDNGYDQCAEFLNVCMKELTNPKSTFYQINRNGNSLAPIEEDTGLQSNETHKKIKGQAYYSS